MTHLTHQQTPAEANTSAQDQRQTMGMDYLPVSHY